MTIRVLDPTNESMPVSGQRAARLPDLRGKRVGFISNGKEGTKAYFAHLEAMLRDELGVGEVHTRIKSSYSKPADPHIIEEARTWDAVFTGIGD